MRSAEEIAGEFVPIMLAAAEANDTYPDELMAWLEGDGPDWIPSALGPLIRAAQAEAVEWCAGRCGEIAADFNRRLIFDGEKVGALDCEIDLRAKAKELRRDGSGA